MLKHNGGATAPPRNSRWRETSITFKLIKVNRRISIAVVPAPRRRRTTTYTYLFIYLPRLSAAAVDQSIDRRIMEFF